MIVSHKYKLIFIKTAKTAGTSVEIALSKYCGPDDIITPISSEDEATRRELGYPGPQNYRRPWWQYWIADILEALHGRERRARRKRGFYNHISAQEARFLLGKEIWNSYFKFTVTRNPFDRIVSKYYYAQRNGRTDQTFDEYLKSEVPRKLRRGSWDRYTIDGRIAVDRVCKYENLANDLEEVRRRVGIPEPLELPHAKGAHRPQRKHYRELFGENPPQWIYEVFKEELEHFGYTY
jgi:hypothetical protein